MSVSLESIFRHDPITAVLVRFFGPEEICRLTATCRYFRYVWLKKHEQTLFLFTRGHHSGFKTMQDWQANIERAFTLRNGGQFCIRCLGSWPENHFMHSKLYHDITICYHCFCQRMRTESLDLALKKMGYAAVSRLDVPETITIFHNKTGQLIAPIKKN